MSACSSASPNTPPCPPTLYLHRQLLPQEAITYSLSASTAAATRGDHLLSICIDSCCHKRRSHLLRRMDGLNGQLLDASLYGDIGKVRSLIERGADVHSRDYHGQTALHRACLYGYTVIVSLLIERGADVHGRDNDGLTALHRACSGGQTATALWLIKRGADVHSRDNGGQTALLKACVYGHTAIASLLVERGADVHGRDNDGLTALHIACRWSKKEAAILLIRSKADIYIQSKKGRTPLDHPPEWREELTQLYEEVNRDWLARRPFLYVLIGCNHIESESNKHSASKQTESEREREEISEESKAIRDEVLRTVYRNIAQYL